MLTRWNILIIVFLVLMKRAGRAESGGRPSGMDVEVSAPLTDAAAAPVPVPLADGSEVLGAGIVLCPDVAPLFPSLRTRSSSSSSSSEKRTRPTRLARELSDRTLPPSSERAPL